MTETLKPTSFTLGQHDMAFITSMVKHGRFGNRTEVVRAGLRLLEDYEYNAKAIRLSTLIAEGQQAYLAGEYTEYDNAKALMRDIMDSENNESSL